MYRQLGLLTDALQQLELAATSSCSGRAAEGCRRCSARRTSPRERGLRIKLAEAASQAGMVDEAIHEFTARRTS